MKLFSCFPIKYLLHVLVLLYIKAINLKYTGAKAIHCITLSEFVQYGIISKCI